MDTLSFPPVWSAEALANAVPLRLSQAVDFNALCAGPPPQAANEPRLLCRVPATSYLPPLAPLPSLRVR